MNEEEFWGRNMEDSRPDETVVSTKIEDQHIISGPIARLDGALPDTNPKSRYGVKKPATLSRIPATAIIAEGKVMTLGGIKYGPFNWRDNSVSAEIYVDAAIRHLMLWNAGEDNDDESGESHLAHVRACMGILIDALETGNLIDDRPKDEATIRAIKDFGAFVEKMKEVEDAKAKLS